jgi:hypothetical protein
MRAAVLGFLLISAGSVFFPVQLFGGRKIHSVTAPQESPRSDDIIISVVASAPDKGRSRSIAVELPQQCSVIAAYMTLSTDLTVTIPLQDAPDISRAFPRERGRTVNVYLDRSQIYSTGSNALIYLFRLRCTDSSSIMKIRTALVERDDPLFIEEVKPKTKKKPKAKDTQWRMVTPSQFDLKFTPSHPEYLTAETEMIDGWETNSRALALVGERDAAAGLNIAPERIQEFFASPFRMSLWYRTVIPFQTLLSLLTPGGDTISLRLNGAGQLQFITKGNESDILLESPYFNDGLWHHCLLERDWKNILRLRLDGEAVDSIKVPLYLNTISTMTFGSNNDESEAYIDEFALSRISKNSLPPSNPITMFRDTSDELLLLFHFEDIGSNVYSSVFLREADTASEKTIARPITLTLGASAKVIPSTSPVLPEEAVLTVDYNPPVKLNFTWKSSREWNVRSYRLERRVSSVGEYRKVIEQAAKQPILLHDSEAAFLRRAMYTAAETLPRINRDINIYYRLALIGYDSVVRYTLPIKIEYGDTKDLFVEQNKPNPFNPTTSITYSVKKAGWLKFAVYDIMGREIILVKDAKVSPGKYSVEIDASLWPSGIYFYKLSLGQQTVTKRMVLVK